MIVSLILAISYSRWGKDTDFVKKYIIDYSKEKKDMKWTNPWWLIFIGSLLVLISEIVKES
jgi:uncharacterized membrane-anchored protein